MDSMEPEPAGDRQRVGDPTSVYRYYDAIGVLIYVGITRQGVGRNVQHNGKAEWWPFVARQEVDHLPTRAAALLREKELIRAHRPPFNKQHNPSYAAMRGTYLAYVRTHAGDLGNPIEVYRALDKRLPMEILDLQPRELVLRSRLIDGPLAILLQQSADAAPVRGQRRSYGYVDRLVVLGPTLTVFCRLRSLKKTRPPEGGIGAAEIVMGWSSKPEGPFIRRVDVIEGDLLTRSGVRRYGSDTVAI